MPKDYKNTRRQSNQTTAPSRWPSFVAGLMLGLSLSVGVVIAERYGFSLPAPVPTDTTDSRPTNSKPAPQEAEKKLQFEFYKILPDREVAVDVEAFERPATDNSEVAEVTMGTFVIQVGSFKNNSDADRLKASVALLGLEANIQVVGINNETWHRVLVGPYDEFSGLKDARARLRENEIPSIVLKLRQ